MDDVERLSFGVKPLGSRGGTEEAILGLTAVGEKCSKELGVNAARSKCKQY